MKPVLIVAILLSASSFGGAANSQREESLAALALIVDAPQEFGSEHHQEAMKMVAPLFVSDLPKLGLPDEVVAWVPKSGPCGGPGSPLLIAFFASVLKDHLEGHEERPIYRAWLVMFRHYRFFRAKFSEEFPPVPAIEEMLKKESNGALRDEAAALEANMKKRDNAPEPAPKAVTSPVAPEPRQP